MYDHWATGKIDGKIAHKPGDFGIRHSVGRVNLFFLSFEEKPEKRPSLLI
jgi:hypothetical protein